MFISKTHLDRRTFLRGVGATVALPLLDAMIPARTALTAASRPIPRVAFVYFPHGAVMREWTPVDGAGPLRLGRILEPLGPFRDRLTVVSGLENRHAYGPVHALTPGTWLSGVSPRAAAGTHYRTADQVAADYIGRGTPLRSIELATEAARPISAGPWEGECHEGVSATISFGAAGSPLSMECRPRQVFDTLFAAGTDSSVRAAGSTSVLDRVAPDVVALKKRIGPGDRAVLDRYLHAIRDVECRVDGPGPASCGDRLRLMFDMMALAFQADITRVATFMMAAETSEMRFEEADVHEPFHSLSHHQNDEEKLEKLVRIQRVLTSKVASFVQALADVPDGDASLLDRSLILYGSNMSDSHAHDHFPLPLALIGGGARLHGGRHLRYPDRTPLSNLLVSILQRSDVPVESFGDSTGACEI